MWQWRLEGDANAISYLGHGPRSLVFKHRTGRSSHAVTRDKTKASFGWEIAPREQSGHSLLQSTKRTTDSVSRKVEHFIVIWVHHLWFQKYRLFAKHWKYRCLPTSKTDIILSYKPFKWAIRVWSLLQQVLHQRCKDLVLDGKTTKPPAREPSKP